MEETYLGKRKNSRQWLFWVLLIILAVVVFGILFYWIFGRDRMIRPIPAKPSFEVVFYTPTPAESTPTSTPSATPKVKAVVKPTTTPKPKATSTPSLSPTP